ncbi:LacI family DNA-binding transcriptional regulator [Devosia sp.]|uniref:LacI family DNA-binding transcriptional regulator n=1 Tax=Devosia sp. TaxID=1871048 RepID=UPI003A920439
MPTLSEVARRAGVSPTTVSRYLNHNISLPQATRDKIEAAVAALGYRPNSLAKRLSTGKAEVIGLVTPDIGNPFFAALAAAVEEAASACGYGVYLSSTGGQRAKEVDALVRLADQAVDGLLMITNQPDDGTLAGLLAQHRNVVLLDENIEGVTVPRVFVENTVGSARATQHLIDMGHRDIAVIAGPRALFSVGERLQGVTEALQANGLALRPDWLFCGNYTRQFGYEAALEIARLTPRPTAILALSDYIAIGVLQALRQLELSVPDDISLVGFDDMPFAELIDPPLTTIRQPIDEMGRVAFARLLALLNGEAVPPVTRLEIELVVRHSVRDLTIES